MILLLMRLPAKSEKSGRASQDAWLDLEKARARLEPLEREIENLHQSISQQEDHLKQLNAEFTDAQQSLQKAGRNCPTCPVWSRVLRIGRKSQCFAASAGAAAQRCAGARRLEKAARQTHSEKSSLTNQIAQLKILERAFGKDGIPALLIEQALPEIESHANEILDRLSDGQHVG